MSEELREFEAGEFLRVIGKVPAPEPSVLEDARDALWSVIASEMLGTGPAGGRAMVTGKLAGGEEGACVRLPPAL